MKASLTTFRCEIGGVPYRVCREDSEIRESDAAWLRENIFDPRDPVVTLAPHAGPDSGDPPGLLHSLHFDGGFLTEVTVTLDLEAAPGGDPAPLLARHSRLLETLASNGEVPGFAALRGECRARREDSWAQAGPSST